MSYGPSPLRTRLALIAALFGPAALALSGCGDDRMKSGTQVEVSDSMKSQAAAQDAYFDQQAKGAAKK